MARVTKTDNLFILTYWVGMKTASVEVWGYSVTVSNGLYCLVNADGYISFEIPKDSFISLARKEALDEQRKTSRTIMLASRPNDDTA